MFVSRDLFTATKNSTMMTINERFTYLQKKARPLQAYKNSAQQPASAKNRQLAMQIERRLSTSAAMKIKKQKSIRQRLGVPISPAANDVRDRLTLPARGKGGIKRGRGGRGSRGRSLRRSQSMQSLQGGSLLRSSSMQSLNQGIPRSRSRSRSRARAKTPTRNRSNSINRQTQRSPSVGRQRRFSIGSFGTPAPGLGRGGIRNFGRMRNQRLRNRGNMFVMNQRNAGNSNRGGRRNFQRGAGGRPQSRGGRRGRGRSNSRDRPLRGTFKASQTKIILPTKEELDKQLEQYMANTKSHLDKEIDTYMKESGVNDI